MRKTAKNPNILRLSVFWYRPSSSTFITTSSTLFSNWCDNELSLSDFCSADSKSLRFPDNLVDISLHDLRQLHHIQIETVHLGIRVDDPHLCSNLPSSSSQDSSWRPRTQWLWWREEAVWRAGPLEKYKVEMVLLHEGNNTLLSQCWVDSVVALLLLDVGTWRCSFGSIC